MDKSEVVVGLQGVRKAFNVGTGIETEVFTALT